MKKGEGAEEKSPLKMTIFTPEICKTNEHHICGGKGLDQLERNLKKPKKRLLDQKTGRVVYSVKERQHGFSS